MWKKKANFDTEVSEAKLILLALAGIDFDLLREVLKTMTQWFIGEGFWFDLFGFT